MGSRQEVLPGFSSDILTVSSTLGYWTLATTATNSDTVDNVALLGLISKTASLVGTRRAGSAVDDVQLSELYFALSAKFNECIARSSMKMSTSNVPQYSLLVCLEDQIRSIGFAVDLRIELSYLPASDTEKEAQDIGLLLLLKLFDCWDGKVSINLVQELTVSNATNKGSNGCKLKARTIFKGTHLDCGERSLRLALSLMNLNFSKGILKVRRNF